MSAFKRVTIAVAWLVAALLPLTTSGQVKPAMVRSVDEPARVPYFVHQAPTCPFTNECYVAGPAVPAGKRVRVTRVEGMLFGQTATIIAVLSLNGDLAPVRMFPSFPFAQAFFGTGVSFNEEVDFFFDAGQTPFLAVGATSPNTVSSDSRNRLTIAGYIVDVLP